MLCPCTHAEVWGYRKEQGSNSELLVPVENIAESRMQGEANHRTDNVSPSGKHVESNFKELQQNPSDRVISQSLYRSPSNSCK